MGRNRRLYPQGKLRLIYNKSKYDSNKKYTVCFEYTWLKSAPIRKDSGIRCKVTDWNENTAQLRASYGNNYKQVNQSLNDEIQKYDSLLRDYNSKHPNMMSVDIIRQILKDAPITRVDGGLDFKEYAEDILLKRYKSKRKKERIKTSRYKNGLSAMKIFTEFLNAKQLGTHITKDNQCIYVSEISMDIIDAYIEYRKSVKHNTDATINHALQPIIDACRQAYADGYINNTLLTDVENCRIGVDEDEYTEERNTSHHYLSEEQLKDIVEFYNNDVEQRRKEYIEMFLFCFHSGGLRPIDMMSLAWENIDYEKKEMTKVLIKTSNSKIKRYTIPLNNAAITILNKWKDRNLNPRFVFNLLPENFKLVDSEELRKTRGSVEVKINQALKVVGEKIGLDFPLTLKIARHSYAVLALQKGMPMSVVSRMLGHSSTATTEHFYAEYLHETLAKEQDKLGFDFLPDINNN